MKLQTECLEKLKRTGRINLADDKFQSLFSCHTHLETETEIRKYLTDERVLFETRDLTVIPQPYVFLPELIERIQSKFQAFYKIVERIPDLYLESAEVRSFFNLPPMFDELIRLECNTRPRVFLCRYDFTLLPDGTPQIYELNAASPAAFIFSRYFYRAIAETKAFKGLQETLPFAMNPFPNQRDHLFMNAIAKHVQRRGPSQNINIGILNSRHNTMVNELHLMEREGLEDGFNVTRNFIEDIEYRDGYLYSSGQTLDIVFQKIDSCPGEDYEIPITRYKKNSEALIQAVKQGTPLLNSFVSCWLLDNKSVLSFLRSELSNSFLSTSEKKLIQEIVPESKQLNLFTETQLQELVLSKDQFVLKKSLDTRGRSVIIGKTISTDEWKSKLFEAKKDKFANYLIQRYVSAEVSLFQGNKRFTSHAMFLLNGSPQGVFTRTASSEVNNVGQGGAIQVPVLAEIKTS